MGRQGLPGGGRETGHLLAELAVEMREEVLRQWQAENADAVNRLGLIIGFGYDPAQMAERRHPTAAELDAVSTQLPVYLIHQSGHFGAAKSLALQRAGFTAATADPPGGIIRRLPDGGPNGVLEETAHFRALGAMVGGLGDAGFAEFARAGARMRNRYGYTTAQQGRADTNSVGVIRRVAAEGGSAADKKKSECRASRPYRCDRAPRPSPALIPDAFASSLATSRPCSPKLVQNL